MTRMPSSARKPIRFNPEVPWMNALERKQFSTERSVFKMAPCEAEECEDYVPKGVKRFCSQACYEKEEGHGNEEDTEEEGWSVA